MEVRRVDPDDEAAFDGWYAVLRETDLERWPDFGGWSRREVHALTSATSGADAWQCLAAVDPSGVTVGIALCEVPQRDNRQIASLDVRVQREHRRRGVGTAIVWSGVVSIVAYKLVDIFIGLRVPEEEEREGLDITEHGESAYHI